MSSKVSRMNSRKSMRQHKFQTREEWELFRRGKLTGSKVKDLLVKRGTEEKVGFYELIAERLAVRPDGENPMMRGTRLEDEAVARFADATGKKVNTDLIIWQDEEVESLAISPDGFIDEPVITEAIEAKCLNSARHVEALLKQKVPKDYDEQIKWYFTLNPTLTTVYMVFYDPRMAVHDFFYLTILRTDYPAGELEALKSDMVAKLKAIDEQVEKLTAGTKLAF